LKLKNEFIFNFNALLESIKNGEIEEADVDTKLLKFAGRSELDAQAMEAAEWSILDPTTRKNKTSEQVHKTLALWRELQKQGALSHDMRFLNGVFSFLDAAIANTAGMGFMAASTDPSSVFNKGMGCFCCCISSNQRRV